MSPFRLALLNLTRRKVPSLIAVVAISISVACSGILLRLNHLSENRFSSMGAGGEALVGAKAGGIEILLGALNSEGEYPGFLPTSLFQSLRANEKVGFQDGKDARPSYIRAIIPLLYFGKLGNFRAVGTDESFLHRPEPEDAISLAEGRWAFDPGEIVLGAQVAAAQSLHVGDSISLEAWEGNPNGVKSVPMRISGILRATHSTWDRMLFSNVESAQRVLALSNLKEKSIWGPAVLNYFLVYLEPNGFAELSSLVNRRTVGQAVLVAEEKQRLQNLTGTGRRLGAFVTVLILALGALSVASMLITRFEAMALQLAVLRALGYRKRVIAGWLLWEGFLLGLSAVALGAVFDAAGFPLMRHLLSNALPPPDLVASHLWESAPIWATALLATTASVFLPLYRVYRQDVHFSLRN